jgi:hypothetical protein
MPAQKGADLPSVPKAKPGFEPGDKVRQLEPVALEIRRLREQEGLEYCGDWREAPGEL